MAISRSRHRSPLCGSFALILRSYASVTGEHTLLTSRNPHTRGKSAPMSGVSLGARGVHGGWGCPSRRKWLAALLRTPFKFERSAHKSRTTPEAGGGQILLHTAITAIHCACSSSVFFLQMSRRRFRRVHHRAEGQEGESTFGLLRAPSNQDKSQRRIARGLVPGSGLSGTANNRDCAVHAVQY